MGRGGLCEHDSDAAPRRRPGRARRAPARVGLRIVGDRPAPGRRRASAGGRARMERAHPRDRPRPLLPGAPVRGDGARLGGGRRGREPVRDPLGARRGSRGGRPVVRDHALRHGRARRGGAAQRQRGTSPASARHGRSSRSSHRGWHPVPRGEERSPRPGSSPQGDTSAWRSARSSRWGSRRTACPRGSCGSRTTPTGCEADAQRPLGTRSERSRSSAGSIPSASAKAR